MIREAEVRRFANQERIDIDVAVREVILTILLARVGASAIGDRAAFKGGTALRKLVFGQAGRFSEDLDFASLDAASDEIQEGLMAVLTDRAATDEVTVTNEDFTLSGPNTLQARFSFTSAIGEGTFQLDVTSSARPVLLGAIRQSLIFQPYFDHLGFDPPQVMTVRSVEMAAEKLAAVHRRSGNRNPKDIWDLWKWFDQSTPDDVDLVQTLWPARLWLDAAAEPDQVPAWRGAGWFERLDADQFDWTRVRQLLPGNRLLAPTQVIEEVKRRLRPWVDDDSDGVLSNVGDRRESARDAVMARVESVRTASG